jgi:hypothetical protein
MYHSDRQNTGSWEDELNHNAIALPRTSSENRKNVSLILVVSNRIGSPWIDANKKLRASGGVQTEKQWVFYQREQCTKSILIGED